MADPNVVHSTFVVERSFPKPPEEVFAALSEPAKVRRWFAEGEHHETLDFTMAFTVGGVQTFQYRMAPGTPIEGMILNGRSWYLDIVPNARVVTAGTMSLGDHIISASQVTFELLKTDSGTDVLCTHQGAFFEGSDGPKMREAGWIALMNKLEKVLGE